MSSGQSNNSAPPPDLRIVSVQSVHPHEVHDSQRSLPLIARLREAKIFMNPPVVAPFGASQYVILDGANRCHSFAALQYPHIMVQVTTYDGGYVELETWQHVVSDWHISSFKNALSQIPGLRIVDKPTNDALCHIVFVDGSVVNIAVPFSDSKERNAQLRKIVALYQENATLYRTAIAEPQEVWPLFPDAIAFIAFPKYTPADIIAAAKYNAFLPPGISRHIIHGRAVMVNYPMDALRDPEVRLNDKNETLREWVKERLANRQVRYYAEATYQFSE